MNRYNNGKIYKLVNSVDDAIYIGSTCMPLAKRKSDHKKKAKEKPNRHVYQHLNNIGWDNVRIILIESVQAFNKDQLLQREQHYIDLLKPFLNKRLAVCKDCPHGKKQRNCKVCKGGAFCKHDKRKDRCKQCGGSQICSHNIRKYQCKQCNGTKYFCFECEHTSASKAHLKIHCKSAKHKNTCIRLFKEVFDYDLRPDEIPSY